ncbi:hemagglutinin family protein, partial [Lasius niger]
MRYPGKGAQPELRTAPFFSSTIDCGSLGRVVLAKPLRHEVKIMKKLDEILGNNPAKPGTPNLRLADIERRGVLLTGRAYLLPLAAALASLGYIASVHAQASIDPSADDPVAGYKLILDGSADPVDSRVASASSLQVLQATAGQTPYYSVNDGGTQGGNYNNNGATGANALAAGVDAQASGASSVAVGQGSSTGGSHDVAIGPEAATQGGNAGANVAIGFGATATGDAGQNQGGSIAIGHVATAGPGSVSIGDLSEASMGDAVAVGFSAQATSSFATALGNNTVAGGSGQSQTAVGTGSRATAQSATALGDNTTAAGVGSLALGGGNSNAAAGASAYGTKDIALGAGAQAGANGGTTGDNIAMGDGAQATAGSSISLGTRSVVSGANSGAFGDANTLAGTGSYAVGNNNSIANNNVFVLGSGVHTSQDNSVVLGNASTDRAAVAVTGATIRGTAYTYAGTASAANGVVSVGAVGKERQVINVAAGQVSANSTDAINGSQLYATNTALESISETAGMGWNLTAQGANGSNVAPGATVNLKNSDGNLVLSKSSDNNEVNFDLAK